MSGKPSLSTDALMPHQPPMRLIETVRTTEADGSGICEAIVNESAVFLEEDGTMAPEALAELMAQAFAAISGARGRHSGRPPQTGYLVGIKQARFFARAHSGDRLQVHVRPAGDFAGFVLIAGEVHCQDRLLASGEMKIWVDPASRHGKQSTP